MIVTVTLTYSELLIASHVGIMRRVQNLKSGVPELYGADQHEGAWERAILGAIVEQALAKDRDRFWSGAVGDYYAADVGNFLQARGTAHPQGRLLLHPKDSEQQAHVLGRVRGRVVMLVGWVYGFEGKQQQYWKELQAGRPCFVVPNEILHDMDTLLEVPFIANDNINLDLGKNGQ